jgi:hypothetical protein
MAYYVGADGYEIALKALECADDAEASEKVRRLAGDHDIELWCGDRFVIRLDRIPEPHQNGEALKPSGCTTS